MEITDGSGFTREHVIIIFLTIPPNLGEKGLS